MSIKDSKILILLLGMLTAFGPIAIDLYLPAFSAMADDLSVAPAKLQYTLTSFFIGLSLGQLIYGPISDKIGRKKPLLFGIGLFTLTSLFIATAQSLESLVLLRFIQALGSCVGMVITRAIIRDCFNAKDIAKVFSLIILVMGAAPILAPLLGSQILYFFDWRAIFYFLAFFGALSFIGVMSIIKESHHISIPYKKSFSNYFNLFKDRDYITATLISGTVMAAMFSYISSSSVVFTEIFNLSPSTYPLFFGLNAFGFIIVSQINIRLLDRYTVDQILKAGLSLFCFNAFLLGVTTYLKLSVYLFEASLFFVVATIGLVIPNITSKALEFQTERAGVASALMGSLQFLIASFGTIVVTSLAEYGVWSMVLSLQFFVLVSFLLYRIGLDQKSTYRPSPI